MKNRRLNVLFIAIIALAATPQAFQDIHSLVNAAHERAETEFWSVFLSYQKSDAQGLEKRAATELVAARRQQETGEACELQPRLEAAAQVAVAKEPNTSRARTESAKAAGEKAAPSLPETIEVVFDNRESVAKAYTVTTVSLPEKEQGAARIANLHARDGQKIADSASKAALASFLEEQENFQIKMKKLSDMDKLRRQLPRNSRDRVEYNYDTPRTIGSM